MGRRGVLGQPTAARWREKRREVIMWCTAHNSPPLETQRLRKLFSYWSFGYRWRNKNKTKQNILHPALLWGREWHSHHLPMSSLLHLWVTRLRASCTCRRGRPQEEAAGFLQRMMCLIALVCFCAAENGWISCTFMSARHSQRWRSWTTSMDIARPRDCAITFVARSARSVAAHSSCITVRSWPPSYRFFRALAWGPAVTPWHGGQKPPPPSSVNTAS